MIINIICVCDECCLSQMNIKLLSLNEENEKFENTGWRRNMFQGPKRWGKLQLRGKRHFAFWHIGLKRQSKENDKLCTVCGHVLDGAR